MATADRTQTSSSGYNPFTEAKVNNRFTKWSGASGIGNISDNQEIAIYQGYFCKAPRQNPITSDVSWKWIFDYLRRTSGPGNDKANNSFVKLMANMIIAGKTNQDSIVLSTRTSNKEFISNNNPIKDRFKWDNITNYPTTGEVDGKKKHSYDLLWPGSPTAAQSNLLTCPSSQVTTVNVQVCNMYSSIISGGASEIENNKMIQECKQEFSDCTGDGQNFRCSGASSGTSPGPGPSPRPGTSTGTGTSPGPGPSPGPGTSRFSISGSFKLSGSVSDFKTKQKESLKSLIANKAGVSKNNVTLVIKSGSVIVDFIIKYATKVASTTSHDNLKKTLLKDTQQLETEINKKFKEDNITITVKVESTSDIKRTENNTVVETTSIKQPSWFSKVYLGLSLWIWLCIIGGSIFLLIIIILMLK